MSDNKLLLENIIATGSYYVGTGANSLCLPQLIHQMLTTENGIIFQKAINGTLIKSLPELFDRLTKLGGRKIVHYSAITRDSFIFLWDNKSYSTINIDNKDNEVSVDFYCSEQSLFDQISDMETEFISKIKTNLIFTIIQTSTGLGIKSLGDGSSPLITDNYLPEVIEDIEYVVKSFNKSPPSGRIAILNGEPGTGKTHLIRSFLSRMDCVFLIIPSNLIGSLDKPEFMPLLLSVKEDHQKPIVMIIEDGDTCLVPRKSDNISTISSLLNLSDGIIGSLIDIKMIISTNAEIRQMDQAIMRPGRLCRNIHVGALPYEQAQIVYQRLMKKEDAKLDYKKHYTLAELYDMTNNVDWVAPKTNTRAPKRAIGFSSAPDPVSSSVDLTVNTLGFKLVK